MCNTQISGSASVPVTVLLTLWFLFAKEALGHFSEELLGRAGRVELWHHHAAAGGKLIGGETLERGEERRG